MPGVALSISLPIDVPMQAENYLRKSKALNVSCSITSDQADEIAGLQRGGIFVTAQLKKVLEAQLEGSEFKEMVDEIAHRFDTNLVSTAPIPPVLADSNIETSIRRQR